MEATTRDAILAVALDEFVANGFAATSIRDLAARLDLTSAALYYHFPSKSAVLEALVLPYLDEVAALEARFPAAATADRAAKRELLGGYVGIILANQKVADLVGREHQLERHPEIGPRLRELIDGMIERLAAPVGDDQSARLRATAAIGALRRPVLRPEIDIDTQVDELLDAAMAVLDA